MENSHVPLTSDIWRWPEPMGPEDADIDVLVMSKAKEKRREKRRPNGDWSD